MQNNKKINTTNKNNPIIYLTKGVVFSYLITAVVFIIYGMLLTYTEMTEKNMQMIVMVTTVISVLIGGVISSMGVNKNGLLFGILVGIVYSIIMIMVSFCIIPSIKITYKMIMIIILSLASGGIGGIIGINSKK